MSHHVISLAGVALPRACISPSVSTQVDKQIVDRCLDGPNAKREQALVSPVGRATSLNSSAESKCVLGVSPMANAADEGDTHSRVSATGVAMCKAMWHAKRMSNHSNGFQQ
mmetsp:Transcript_34787/g.48429  ORF Transcript_34787/g.48429 Transcript_34787/m.48429 type:complete len:111 (-) Transcript_34787:479-811(-)